MPVPDNSPLSPVPERSGLPAVAPDIIEQELQDEIDNIVPTRGYQMLPMIGLGGSAGSISVLQSFFTAMPADSGMVFVVILHLSPERESMLPDLLQRCTRMRVIQAQDGQKVEANCVYVIPPAKHLISVNGHLRLSPLEPERGKRVAVDLFFRSLADTHGAHSTAIVLSGADGDGAIGLKRIKERGGLTIAQDPGEAEHSSMPRSAIDTGMVDWVLPIAEMPQRILRYHATAQRLKVPSEEGPNPVQAAPPPSSEEGEAALREVLLFLRTRTGRDFSYYKRATILRRIARRMQVNGLEDLPSYLEFLRTHLGEAGALLQDMLISVTNFFRDRQSFEVLGEHIPHLFRNKLPGEAVRVWVAACATGEEAYSIAMLLLEHARTLEMAPAIQVFACDLDEEAIQMARAGVYQETITADVSEERLRRFFVKEHHGYRLRRELREVVLFAEHDLLKDAPFSRMDLISCRNLLIYLNREAQARALDIFHFALRPEGRLFLGTSESVDEESPLFKALDKKHRIFRRQPGVRVNLPVPAGPGTLVRSMQAQDRARGGPVVPGTMFAQHSELPIRHGSLAVEGGISRSELHFKLIERYAPPSIVVNQSYDIVHLSENAGRFLQHGGGEPTMNLLRVIHPALRIELRTALFRAAESGLPVEVPRVLAPFNEVLSAVDIRVAPAQELAPGFLLVVFEAHSQDEATRTATPRTEPEPVVRHLERELEQVKGHLRDMVEQNDASTEELKASNEELQAMNEELRSATEELETSREELQSINEELTTVNQELKARVEDLGQANSDLQNLMASTAISLLFLDRDLRIMRYTPPAVPLFHLITGDLGRPLGDLKHRLDYPELLADAERVLRTLEPVEREIADQDNHWFLARILPYRTVEDQIAGVVLTFVNVTEMREAQMAVRATEEEFRRAIEDAPIPIVMQAEDGEVLQINRTWTERTGYALADLPTFEKWLDHASGAGAETLRAHVHDLFAQARRTLDVELSIRPREGKAQHWSFSASSPGRLRDGRRFIVGMAVDITQRKRAEQELRESEERLRLLVDSEQAARKEAESAGRTKDQFLATLSHELRTPLTPVLLTAESLLRRSDLPPRVSAGLQMICRNIEVENHFIDDLLDITRISRGKFELARDPLNVHDAIRAAIQISEPDIAARAQELSVDLRASGHWIRGDAHRVEQVFWNLLKNASKFTENAGKIRIVSRNEPGWIVVEVSDTGMGIDPNALGDIFEAFRQGDSSITRKFGGLGLGLAISKATVDALDGTIDASSEGAGQGALFTVKLPLAENVISTPSQT